MSLKNKLLLAALTTTILSGCGTPFGGRLDEIKWGGKTRQGTITVSDPKLYLREELINERRDEVEWIDELLKESREIEFKPEILREVETIQALSLGLGLKFDPASAASFQRADETAGLQQEINAMRLQLQLDELKRDAEIIRAQSAARTELVNADVAALGDPTDVEQLTSIEASAAAQKLNELITALQTRLDAETRSPLALSKNTSANPIDLFRDRRAYRNLLKNARSAATLDELHDLGGAQLLRLTFQATVLPIKKDKAAPGIVQMRIKPPSKRQLQDYYLNWIDFQNESIFEELNEGDKDAPTGVPGLDTVAYTLTPKANIDCFGVKLQGAKKRGVSATEAAAIENVDCQTLEMIAPRLVGPDSRSKSSVSIDEWVNKFFPLGHIFAFWDEPPAPGQVAPVSRKRFATAQFRGVLSDVRGRVIEQSMDDPTQCSFSDWIVDPQGVTIGEFMPAADGLDNSAQKSDVSLLSYLHGLQTVAFVGEYFDGLDTNAAKYDFRVTESDKRLRVRQAAEDARFTLEEFEFRVLYDCANAAALRKEIIDATVPSFQIPSAFQRELDSTVDAISIYDVGPREQVQQVGTNARAANSVGLALAIAGSKPGSGVGGNLDANFARQASGKAEVRERVPAVVGYSVGSKDTFGWVLGPRATLDPKGKLDLGHGVKPYDLTVDLSVPGWWGELSLEVVTAWSPERPDIVRGTIVGDPTITDEIGVELPLRKFALDDLTRRLTEPRYARNLRRPTKPHPGQQTVAACRTTYIHLEGAELTRAKALLIKGFKIEGTSNIALAPDMNGVVITVPPLHGKIGKPKTKDIEAILLTSLEPVPVKLTYEGLPSGKEACNKAPDPKAFSVAKFADEKIIVNASTGAEVLRLSGKNFDKVKAIEFNQYTIPKSGFKIKYDNTRLEITVPRSELASLSGRIPLVLYSDDNKKKVLDELVVEIDNQGDGK